MKKQYDYKAIITICCLYEIVAFLVLYTHDFCDLWLYPCGFQYIILCLICPVCAILLWVWKKDIFKKCKFVQKRAPFLIASLIFFVLGAYLLCRPTIIHFNNGNLKNVFAEIVKTKCFEEENKTGLLTNNYDINDKCNSISSLVSWNLSGKTLTKRQVFEEINEIKRQFVNFPNYATKSCADIAYREAAFIHEFNKDKTKSYHWEMCVYDMVAFNIKKNSSYYFSDQIINKNLYQIRESAKEYCDKQTKKSLDGWYLSATDFCKANKI